MKAYLALGKPTLAPVSVLCCPKCNETGYITHLLFWSVMCVSRRSIIYIYRFHDDVIKWKHFPRYWPFVRGIHRSLVNSPHKGQWRGALMFSLICVWINGWVNNGEVGDLRRYRTHFDVTVMLVAMPYCCIILPRIKFGHSFFYIGSKVAQCRCYTGTTGYRWPEKDIGCFRCRRHSLISNVWF